MNMTFSILLVGAPILVGARGSCPICPMVNPALAPDPAGRAYSAPPDPLAVEGKGKGGEGRGADSVSCPLAHMTLATPLSDLGQLSLSRYQAVSDINHTY